MKATWDNEGIIANEPPDLWDESHEKPVETPKPVSKAVALKTAREQISKWAARERSVINDDDALMESRDAYNLLASQAKLFADLIERIK